MDTNDIVREILTQLATLGMAMESGRIKIKKWPYLRPVIFL